MITLYFLRHLPTDSNLKNCWCGRKTDKSIDLSEAKIYLNSSTYKEISSINFDYIYLSPMKRCQETANFLKLKGKQIIDQRLIERDFGTIEQQPCDQNIKLKLADWWLNTDLNSGVEKIQDIYNQRLLPFINDLKLLPSDSKVLIISHSWLGRLLKYYFSHNQNDINIAPKNGQLLKFNLEQ